MGAEAKCSDWAMNCQSGTKVGTNDAPADSEDGKGLSADKFEELCCEEPPKTCATYSAVWLASQVLNQGCAEDTKFFDTKKLETTVADPAGEAEIKAACCTP